MCTVQKRVCLCCFARQLFFWKCIEEKTWFGGSITNITHGSFGSPLCLSVEMMHLRDVVQGACFCTLRPVRRCRAAGI